METDAKMRRNKIVAKIISAVIAGIGIYIVFGVMIPFLTRFDFDEPISDIFFLVVVIIPFLLVGSYFLRVAYRTWSGVTSDNVGSVAITAVIVFFCLFLALNCEPFGLSKESGRSLELILTLIVSGVFYLICKKGLLVFFEIEDKLDYVRHRKSTKVYFGVMAFLLYGFLTNLWRHDLGLKVTEGEEIDGRWISAFVTFGMIPVVFGFYRLCLRLFLRKPVEELQCPESAEEDLSNTAQD